MITTRAQRSTRPMNILEKNLLGVKIDEVPQLFPGLLAAVLVAWFSVWLSQYIGVTLMGFEKTPVSAVTVAILLGLVVSNLFALPAWLKPGLTFTVKKVLRLGIILLGIRLSVFDVLQLGALGVPIVLVCILSALFLTARLTKRFGLPERLGTLLAVGTSICGVSAIVATGPAIDAKDEEVAYAVSVITVFGIIATLVYPYAAYAIFAGDPVKAGLFLGTAIHDTSQVTGAALIFADVYGLPRGLDVATVAKLVRNTFMAAVIPLMALHYARRGESEGTSGQKRSGFAKFLPAFIIGFLVLSILRSLGDAGIQGGGTAFGIWNSAAWGNVHGFVKEWAVNFLVLALAGVGLSTNFRAFKGLGIKPFIVGLAASLALGVVSFIAISLLGTFGAF